LIKPKTYEHCGTLKTIAQLAVESGQPAHRIRMRISRGYSIDQALNTAKLSHGQAARRGKNNHPWDRKIKD
jgi:hypothetical protein